MAAFGSKRLQSHPSIPVLYRTLSVNTSFTITGKAIEPKYDRMPELDQSVDEICVRLQTHKTRGLPSETAKQRQLKYGANVLSPPRTNYLRKILTYVFGGFNFLMWVAAVLVFISWKPLSGDQASAFQLGVGVLLLIVIAISTFFYALVDYRASQAMASIRSLVANTAFVKRDGEVQKIDAETLVRGDLVCLQYGQRVPADLRLIDVSADARFDRSILTGESKPIAATVDATSLNPLESKNMGLSSTFLVRGTARGIVIRIGNDTVIGNILKISIAGVAKPPLSPIQKDIAFFTVVVSSLAVFFFSLAIAVWGGWLQYAYPAYETAAVAIINAIGALIAFVPQGLPICFALALTIIARRMAKQNVLVKNLNMVETLGCISVLCSDKTGTLTVGKMAVDAALFVDAVTRGPTPDLARIGAMSDLFAVARICNDAAFQPNTEHVPVQERPVNGDATDSAILRYCQTIGPLVADLTRFEVVFSLSFNSKNKFMAKIVRWEHGPATLLVKGAPDILTRASSLVMQSDGTVVEFDREKRQDVVDLKDAASRKGHRVIAHCQKHLGADAIPTTPEDLEPFVEAEVQHGLTLIGLLALSDPPRHDVPDVVRRLRHAGIRVFMVTGDFELTACSIATSVGIISVAEGEITRVADLDTLKEKDPLPPHTEPYDLRPEPGAAQRAIVINGAEVESLLEDDWDYIAATFSEMVFARTTPEQKLLIVENLKKRGDNIVAVTGDGTNDAPALRAADVGVSMGSGTDIAKEAATMILMTNAFSSLLVGVENGRLVFENLKKVLLYLMPAGTYTEFIAVASSAFLGMQIPLSAFQQVLFCVTNDLIMSISLMYEKPEADLMDRPPRNGRTVRLTDWRFFVQIYLIIGPMIWISSMGMWFLYMSTQGLGMYDLLLAFDRWRPGWQGKTGDELTSVVSTGQGIYYVTMAVCQIGSLFAIRNRTVSILQSNPFWGPRQNWFIPFAIACNIAICIIILYGYWIQVLFATSPIPLNYWFIPFGFALFIVVVDEVRKYLVRNYPRSPVAKMAW